MTKCRPTASYYSTVATALNARTQVPDDASAGRWSSVMISGVTRESFLRRISALKPNIRRNVIIITSAKEGM